MKSPKVDMSGVEAANKAMAEATAAAGNLQKNFQTDLKSENLTKVEAGGASEIAAAASPTAKRRKTSGGGLASTLGVNV